MPSMPRRSHTITDFPLLLAGTQRYNVPDRFVAGDYGTRPQSDKGEAKYVAEYGSQCIPHCSGLHARV